LHCKQVLALNLKTFVVSSGVESFDVDIKEQKVTVKGNVTPDAVLQTVSKTGKKTSFWEAEPSASAVSS
uniref:HMA domain-containing protein n=1 Tax=Aegilops tauschii subsp. strangulata TaxID=200361 RepID=A0A453S8N9_AEGTS